MTSIDHHKRKSVYTFDKKSPKIGVILGLMSLLP